MLYDTTIAAVNSKTVNRKSDGKTITIFEVTDGEGRQWTTARRDIANEAHRLLNQNAQIQGTIKQNGTYENFYLDDVQPYNQLNQSFQQQQVHQQQQQQQQAPPPQPRQQAPEAPRIVAEGEGTPKDWTVWRQTATKVAAHLATTPAEFWDNVGQLITFYATGLMPELRPVQTPSQQRQEQGVTSYAPVEQAQQAQQTNQFVPDGMEPFNQNDPAYDPDSDIPFN